MKLPDPEGSKIPEDLGNFRIPNPKGSRISNSGTFRIPNPEEFPENPTPALPRKQNPGFFPPQIQDGISPCVHLSLKTSSRKGEEKLDFPNFFPIHYFQQELIIPAGSGLEIPSPCPNPSTFCCSIPIFEQNSVDFKDFPFKPFPTLPNSPKSRAQLQLRAVAKGKFPILPRIPEKSRGRELPAAERREWPGFDLGIPGPMDTIPPFFFYNIPFYFFPLENGSLPLEFTLGKREGSSFTKPPNPGRIRENPGKTMGKRGCGAW